MYKCTNTINDSTIREYAKTLNQKNIKLFAVFLIFGWILAIGIMFLLTIKAPDKKTAIIAVTVIFIAALSGLCVFFYLRFLKLYMIHSRALATKKYGVVNHNSEVDVSDTGILETAATAHSFDELTAYTETKNLFVLIFNKSNIFILSKENMSDDCIKLIRTKNPQH